MAAKKWKIPADLKQYDRYTNYPGRAEELANSPASVFSNHVVALMRAEVTAQYVLLDRLRTAGLLAASIEAADSDLREALRRELAYAEQIPYEQLEPHDYQKHVDGILALLITRDLEGGES